MAAVLEDRRGVQSEVGQENTGVIERSASLPTKTESAPESGPVSAFRHFRTQPAVQRSMPAISVILAIVLFVSFGFILNSTGYQSVSIGMTESDRQASYEALVAAKYDARINSASGMVEVPDGEYQAAKLFLASQGLPRSAVAGGFSSLNETASMTQSQFMEQVRYNNAMEVELAKTISEIDSIESARVHITVNKQSVFVRDRMPSKASVVLKPYFGRVVTQPQTQSILHLVSSSVPFMSITDVTVVDNYGNLLSAAEAGDGLSASKNIAYERKMESALSQRILDLLIPVLGEGNVKSIVNVDMDFTETESTYEEFDRSGSGPKTRSEILNNDATSGLSASGVPGGTSNIVPADPVLQATGSVNDAETGQLTEQTQRTQTTRNYELDKAVRYVKEQSGRVLGVTAAIMINETALIDLVRKKLTQADNAETGSSAEITQGTQTDLEVGQSSSLSRVFDEQTISEQVTLEVEKFRNLVTRALPYDIERGDDVRISIAPFYVDAPIRIVIPWWEQEGIVEWGKHGFTVIAFLFLLLFVVRPIMSFYLPKLASDDDLALIAEQPKDGELSDADVMALEQGESLEEIKAKLKPKKSSISADMLDTANSYDDKVALIRLLVAEDSGRVANVLKKMIKPA